MKQYQNEINWLRLSIGKNTSFLWDFRVNKSKERRELLFLYGFDEKLQFL
jgi:hypothetical protein